MGWIYFVLLAGAVLVVLAAEWPRIAARFGIDARTRRQRGHGRRKGTLRLVTPDESEEFAASVERDLSRLPTIEERNGKR